MDQCNISAECVRYSFACSNIIPQLTVITHAYTYTVHYILFNTDFNVYRMDLDGQNLQAMFTWHRIKMIDFDIRYAIQI